MNSTIQVHGEGLTLRQAAMIAGFDHLLGPGTYAEFSIYPKLVVPDNIAQTVQTHVFRRDTSNALAAHFEAGRSRSHREILRPHSGSTNSGVTS
ncbi:MAG TPA: hypothetical protein VGG04_17775 [Candidatus Sulfotelmatobacter sp.]|jgi:hypothetical protein